MAVLVKRNVSLIVSFAARAWRTIYRTKECRGETALAGADDRHEPIRGSESAVEAVDARPFGEKMGLAS
jgi:hypothetical protein